MTRFAGRAGAEFSIPRAGRHGATGEEARISAEILRTEAGSDPFAASVRATSMAMIITDPRLPDNPVVFVNDAFCRLTGYDRQDVVGRNCRFLQGPLTDPAAIERIREAIRTERPIAVDIRNHRKTGEPFWNHLMVAPVHDAEGALTYYFASQVDVTEERERLEGLETHNAALVAELASRLQAQEESEARLRFATTAGRLGVWELDLVSGELAASPIWRESFGHDPAVKVTSQTVLGAVHADDRDRVAAAFQHALTEGEAFAEEFGVVRPDGSVGWLDLRAQVVRGTDGTPLRMAGTSVDITARHAAERGLELSEAHLRLATEAAGIGTWDLDMATDVLTWSDRTKAMFGFAPEARCTMADFYAGLHPDDRDDVTEAFASAIDPRRRSAYDVEYRTIGHDDGIIRWIAAKGRALFDEGRCTRAMGTAIDISDRKSVQDAQAMLLALIERMRMATDPLAIVSDALEALGRHLRVQRAGYGRVQDDGKSILLGTGYTDLLPPLSGTYPLQAFGPEIIARQRAGLPVVIADTGADAEPAQVDWRRAGIGALVSVPLIRGGAFRANLFVNTTAPRAWTPHEVQLIQDVAALIWDTVERVRAEEALRQLNATLEARVEQRTAELREAEDALRQAQKMEAVGQLTGGIAHDFNNLLTGIVGALELLQRRVADGRTGDLGRYADMAVTSANRAAALTQRLLAFSRRQPLDPRPVEVNRLLQGMEELLRRTLGPSIALEMVAEPALWVPVCDPNQLESAILNLAINARDAMNGRDVKLTGSGPAEQSWRLSIATGNVTLDEAYARAQGGEVEPGQYVVISVSDTGTGMTPEVIERAFEPFFTTKPVGQGTGLGLSMVYGFIKQSRGHVRILSEPGRGTTFRLYLPRGGRRAEDLAETQTTPAPVRAGAGERVLVVEDEPAVRALIMETLQEMGFFAIAAADGPAALEIIRGDGGLDLLIADLGLPGLGGREVADEARALRPGLRVLFITGFGAASGAAGKLEAGMQMLAKPFAMPALAAKLRVMLAP